MLAYADVTPICNRHGIPPRFRRDFLALANEGEITRPSFGRRLRACLNFQAVTQEIMELLSRPLLHLFERNVRFQSLEVPL